MTRAIKKDQYRFLILLLVFGIILAAFYYVYLKHYTATSIKENGYPQFPLYGQHFFEYYMRSVVLWDSIMNLRLSDFYYYYNTSYTDKISLIRSLPFFFVFGPSQFVFIYSNFFFNYFILVMIYLSTTRIFKPKESFTLSLFLVSNYACMILLLSPYMDLTFMLACALFYIELFLFQKNHKKANLGLMLSVFFLFLIKNTAYVVVPFFSIAMMAYFITTKKQSGAYCLKYATLVGVGVVLYWLLALKFTVPDIISSDLSLFKNLGIGNAFTPADFFMNLKIILSNLFLEKAVVFLLYLSMAYLLFREKDSFWVFLFFIACIYLMMSTLTFFKFGFQLRYLLPLYFIFAVIIFKALSLFLRDWLKHDSIVLLAFVLLMLSLSMYSLVRSTDQDFEKLTYITTARITEFINSNILFNLSPKSRIRIYEQTHHTLYYDWTTLIEEYPGFFTLAEIDERFRYDLRAGEDDDFSDVDYILHDQTYNLQPEGFRLKGVYDVSKFGHQKADLLFLWEKDP
ncbi:hypothetical protein JXC34_07475 [Candidatus Woesearchaeota archaeon]|nr:hypothetical protein [Candidatus Woesearchaeota archaeon]